MNKKIRIFIKQMVETINHFSWGILLIIPIFLLINWSFFSTLSSQREAVQSEQFAIANQELNNINFFINRQMSSIVSDIHVIGDADETQTYLNDKSQVNLNEYRSLVFRILSNKAEFVSASHINVSGQEIFKISRDHDGVYIVEEPSLIDISDREYFSDLLMHDRRELYLDKLHIYDDKPVLSIIAPIFDEINEIDSFFKLDYDANHFLSFFELYTNDISQNFSIGFINIDNLWLIDQENDSFYLSSNESYKQDLLSRFNTDENIVYRDILVNRDDSYFKNISNDFFRVYIDINMQAFYNASEHFIIRNPWIIVPINLLVLLIISYMAYVLKTKSDDRILLNANMYLSNRNIDGVLITENNFTIYYVNPAFEKFFGYTLNEIKNKHPRDVIGQTGIKLDYDTHDFKGYENNLWNKTKDDIKLLKYISIKKEDNPMGKTKHYIAIYSEPHIEIDDYFKYMESKDQIISDLSMVFRERPFTIGQTSLFLIRTDFTSIHILAKYLKKNLDERYVVCIPKSKFILLYVDIKSLNIQRMSEHLITMLENYRHFSDTDSSFTYKVAAATADESMSDISSLMQALIVVYQISKNNPQLKYHIYTPEMKESIHRNKMIYESLDNAFKDREFYLCYQVQKNLSDGSVAGAEALMRWNSPVLGRVSPVEFIPIIENSVFINQLSVFVLDLVIKDFEPYSDIIPSDFKISINLTNFDLNSDSIITEILTMIDHSILPNAFFSFEITESNYIDQIDKANRIIAQFHKKGIILSIDDFGTGYSSINSLKSIDIDQVKIDRNFISNYPKNDDGSMLKIITTLIHSLKKKIIVEGTETMEQVDFCRKNNCHIVQGYYQSKPIPIREFAKRFIKHSIGEQKE